MDLRVEALFPIFWSECWSEGRAARSSWTPFAKWLEKHCVQHELLARQTPTDLLETAQRLCGRVFVFKREDIERWRDTIGFNDKQAADRRESSYNLTRYKDCMLPAYPNLRKFVWTFREKGQPVISGVVLYTDCDCPDIRRIMPNTYLGPGQNPNVLHDM
ncbi:hypothetical protein OBBRIDRAFT_789183 [Obba rivulosa]|uniref:Uncharacterized protein n=1 Tax=Obba rivulosa TaxID=1052685 RepID=A0A8E2J6P9_9APHY|nr:hypothetical protein OBBRIDRAFT_789183 [Obba rivulosa]